MEISQMHWKLVMPCPFVTLVWGSYIKYILDILIAVKFESYMWHVRVIPISSNNNTDRHCTGEIL
jgi:hypothetical protein